MSQSISNRVYAPEYLDARSKAWESGTFDDGKPMDPCITDFRHDDVAVMLWLAFMAGSDWERRYTGRRYNDELTSS